MKTWTIKHGSEFMKMDELGQITRPAIGMNCPSGQWRVTGAVLLDNFGHTLRRYSLEEVKAGGIQWFHKNGKQRVFVTDFDHGANRMWTCSHSITA